MTTLQWISLSLCLIAAGLVVWGYALFVRGGEEDEEERNVYGRFE